MSRYDPVTQRIPVHAFASAKTRPFETAATSDTNNVVSANSRLNKRFI